jgi:hypothetical protein
MSSKSELRASKRLPYVDCLLGDVCAACTGVLGVCCMYGW